MVFRLEIRTLSPDELEPSLFKVIKIDIKYFENGDRYHVAVNGTRIGYHPRSIDWHQDL